MRLELSGRTPQVAGTPINVVRSTSREAERMIDDEVSTVYNKVNKVHEEVSTIHNTVSRPNAQVTSWL